MFRAATVSSQQSLAPRRTNRPRKDNGLTRVLLAVAAAGLDALTILALAAIAGLLQAPPNGASRTEVLSAFLFLGGAAAIAFPFVTLVRGEYAAAKRHVAHGLFRRTAATWALAVIGTYALAFLLQTDAEFAPLALFAFLSGGFVATYLARLCFLKATESGVRPRSLTERRIFLVGDEESVHRFAERHETALGNSFALAATALRGPEHLDEDLALACAAARIFLPDDVFILVPWSDTETIDACVEAFRCLPADIHLGAEALLKRFNDVAIAQIGPIAGLNLVRRPLSPLALATKRALDVALAGCGLVLLAPLLLIVAIAIKLDSPGPILFRQRRYGFNQQHFRIFKFRSMRTTEDSANLKQVVKGDPRVTRVGKFMRRHNIDELPQLINVLIGDMSLVGPRPHALVHDQIYEKRIENYARRHTVKPGITGWAQVNGFRGGFSEFEMRRRLEYDLFYIDNWSLWFDIKILWLTLMSKKSYENAY